MLWLGLWLAAVTLIHPLAWELPHAVGVVLKTNNNNKEQSDQHAQSEVVLGEIACVGASEQAREVVLVRVWANENPLSE